MLRSILSSIRQNVIKTSDVRVIIVRNDCKKVDPGIIIPFKPEPDPCPSKHTPKIPIVCENVYAKNKAYDDALAKCMEKNAGHVTPPCTTKFFEWMPCHVRYPKRKIRKFMGTTAWEKPPCCRDRNNCALTRADFLYLKPEKKCFQRTWCEFPPERCRARKVCKARKVVVAEPERRPRGQINKATTKSQPPIDLCSKCPKITMLRCTRARDIPQCLIKVRPSCCKKRCTLYPSFSECCRQRAKPLHPKECGCLTIPGICQIHHPFTLKDFNEDN